MAADDPVFSPADLENWSFPGTALAVLGYPIGHSISPPMHNAALAELAKIDHRFRDWKYFRFEVRPEELAQTLSRLHAKRFRGLNLTMPHKTLAFDQIAAVDAETRVVHAVNTLRWEDDGWHGFNTDGYGLATGLREDLGIELRDKVVVLLGAGGAARGAAVECLAQSCAALWIGNRTRAHLEALLTDLRPLAGKTLLQAFDPQDLPDGLPAGALVLNATSAGLRESDLLPIDLGQVPRPLGVYDMIYNPPRTRLLEQAASLGLPFSNGLSMLIHQGARALEMWTEKTVPVGAMRRGAESVLAK